MNLRDSDNILKPSLDRYFFISEHLQRTKSVSIWIHWCQPIFTDSVPFIICQCASYYAYI